MRVLDNVPRIATPSPAQFLREWVQPRRPVILKDAFGADPITRVTTREAALDLWSELPIKTRANYLAAFTGAGGGDADGGVQTQTLTDYLRHVDAQPRTQRCCVEHTTPAAVRAQFDVPAVARELEHVPDDLLSLMFVANAGNSAHLHIDIDHRQVLLHQVFGRKRVMVVDPAVGRKVLPVGATGGLMLEEMDEDDKLRVAEFLGASDTLLEPGETLFIPALAWHYVDYVDTGMSFSLRFARRPLGRFIAENVFHDLHVQNVGAALATVEPDEDVSVTIRDAVAAEYPGLREKYLTLRAVFRLLCDDLCPRLYRGRYALASDVDALEERLGTQFYATIAGRGGDLADTWRR